MASIISTKTSGGGGIAFTGDTSGVLQLASNNGTTGAELDASQLFKFNSGYGSVATAYGCRVWANFGYVSGSLTTRGSGGVSSITRSGTGLYVVNFSVTMPDTNYTVTTSCSDDATSQTFAYISGNWGVNNTTTKITIQVANLTVGIDRTFIGVSIFR